MSSGGAADQARQTASPKTAATHPMGLRHVTALSPRPTEPTVRSLCVGGRHHVMLSHTRPVGAGLPGRTPAHIPDCAVPRPAGPARASVNASGGREGCSCGDQVARRRGEIPPRRAHAVAVAPQSTPAPATPRWSRRLSTKGDPPRDRAAVGVPPSAPRKQPPPPCDPADGRTYPHPARRAGSPDVPCMPP